MKKYCLLVFGLLFLLINSCNNKKEEQPKDVDTVVPEKTISAREKGDYLGTYTGVIPCYKGDCQVNTEIKLIDDSHFIYSTVELGKDIEPEYTAGNYEFDSTGNIISLDEISNEPNTYFIGDKVLYKLDDNQQKIEGSLSEKYILKKVN